MTSRALRQSGGIALGALLLLVLMLLRQRSELPLGDGAPPAKERPGASSASPRAPLPASPQSSPPLSSTPEVGRLIRYRYPDGKDVVFVDTEATRQERFDWATKGKAQLQAERSRFDAEFRRIFRGEGAQVALASLEKALDLQGREIPLLAARYASLRILAEIQRDLLQGPSLDEPVGRAATSLLLRVLDAPGEYHGDRNAALAYLGGLQFRFQCAGRIGRRQDGMETYDLSEPPFIHLSVEPPKIGRDPSRDYEAAQPSLGNPEIVQSVLRIVADATLNGSDRSQALRVLATRPQLLDSVDLAALALQAPEEMAEAVVWALSRRPDKLSAIPFATLVESQGDFGARALAWEACSGPAFDAGSISGLVDRSLPLPTQPPPLPPGGGLLGRTIALDDLQVDEAGRCRERVLQVVLRRYEDHRDPALFDLLSRRLGEWSRWEPREGRSGTPAASILDGIFENRWDEFAPLLRSLREEVRDPSIGQGVKRALDRIDGLEKRDP